MLDGRGFVPADFDRDGDLDFFIVNNDQPTVYLENRCGDGKHWLTVQLRGVRDNAYGIGAKVYATTTNTEGAPLRQMRHLHAGSGYLSSPAPEVHFGVDAAERIDRLEVHWPNGERQLFEGIETDAVLTIDQDHGIVTRMKGNVPTRGDSSPTASKPTTRPGTRPAMPELHLEGAGAVTPRKP